MIWDILLQSCSERCFLDHLTTLVCLEISHSEPSECAGHPAKPHPSLSTSTALLLFPPPTITLRAGPALLRLIKICLQDPALQPLASPYGWNLNAALGVWGNFKSFLEQKETKQREAVARFQDKPKAATLPSRSCASVPGSGPLQRRMGMCKLEDCTFDSFELLYSGAVDKVKSHKSNFNLSKFVTSRLWKLWAEGLRILLRCNLIILFLS